MQLSISIYNSVLPGCFLHQSWNILGNSQSSFGSGGIQLIADVIQRTLHKIYNFIEAQRDGKKIKHLFRQSEMNKLLKDCHAGLDHALEVFNVSVC